MRTQPVISEPIFHNIPVIDNEFDSFELNHDMMESLREVEVATFYHDAFDTYE